MNKFRDYIEEYLPTLGYDLSVSKWNENSIYSVTVNNILYKDIIYSNSIYKCRPTGKFVIDVLITSEGYPILENNEMAYYITSILKQSYYARYVYVIGSHGNNVNAIHVITDLDDSNDVSSNLDEMNGFSMNIINNIINIVNSLYENNVQQEQ